MSRLMLLLAALALAGSAKADVLYEEYFSDGTADLSWFSPWGEEADQVTVDWMAGNPSGDGFVGKLGNGLSGGGVGTVVVDAPELEDYRVEAQIYLTPGDTHYRGIVGRAMGDSEGEDLRFYAFVADLSEATGMGDQRFMLRTYAFGGMPDNIQVWEIGDLGDLYPDEAGWYKLSMEFDGNQVHCYIDDEELTDSPVTDGSYSDGGFGVYFWDFMDFESFIYFDDVIVSGEASAVDSRPLRPRAASLEQNAPNPFNPSTELRFRIERPGKVRLKVFDLRGRLVRSLVEGGMPAGEHRVSWDGRNREGGTAASGMYLTRLEALGEVRVRRMLLVR